ncbi:hypothetical protein BH20ACT11_BH20ACT11_14970 [soil metagenome]
MGQSQALADVCSQFPSEFDSLFDGQIEAARYCATVRLASKNPISSDIARR